MIERVARAMWDAREQTLPSRTRVPFDDRLTNDIWVMARAAIEAMREPTEAMVAAIGGRCIFDPSLEAEFQRGYREMIDAALSTSKCGDE